MPTMTAQQVYAIISQWGIPVDKLYSEWKRLYNWLPPETSEATTVWEAAGQIAAAYEGPPIT